MATELKNLLSAHSGFRDIIAGLDLQIKKRVLYVSFLHPYLKDWFLLNRKEAFEALCKKFFALEPVEIIYLAAPPRRGTIELCQPVMEHASNDGEAFEAFLSNEKSRLALEAARKALTLLPDGHSTASFIPPARILTVCGATGCGKTYLLDLIYNELRNRYPCVNFLKTETAAFCRAFFDLKPGAKKFAHAVVLLDKFEQISASRHWQIELLERLEAADKNENPFKYHHILAYGSTIDDLALLHPGLKGKIEAGLVVELAEPDLEIRLKFIDRAFKSLKLSLSREQALYIARNASTFSRLKGAIHKIENFIKLYNRIPADLEMERLLGTWPLARPDDSRSILARVAKRLNLKPDEILGNARNPNIVLARQLAMYLCRKILGLSYPELGRVFGGKDHSTVIHSIKKITRLRDTDKVMHKLITELENWSIQSPVREDSSTR